MSHYHALRQPPESGRIEPKATERDMENEGEIRDLLRKMHELQQQQYELQQQQFSEYKRLSSVTMSGMRLWRRVLVLCGIVILGGIALISYGVYRANERPAAEQRHR
jgi:hypothetical protein